MKKLSPDQIAQKWVDRMGAATQAIKDGVMSVTTAPGKQAAARQDAYVQGVMANQDKWARRVASVTLQDWQNAMIQKGIPAITQRVGLAKNKFAFFMSQWLPFVQQAMADINNTYPRGTLEQNIARSAAMIRAAHAFGSKAGRP